MWVTVFPRGLGGRKNILSSGLNTFPNETRCVLSPCTQACPCGITDRLIMRCWAIRTAHSHRDSESTALGGRGGDSWCSSTRGVKLQRSTFLIMACKVGRRRPFERKQGGKSGGGERESMRQRWRQLFSLLSQLYCPFQHQWQKNVFNFPSPWWCLIAGCQVRLHQPDGAGQLEPNSWWRLWCIVEAADDSHVAPMFISSHEAATHLPSFIMSFIQPVCEDLAQISLMTNVKCCHLNLFKWQECASHCVCSILPNIMMILKRCKGFCFLPAAQNNKKPH